MRKSVLVCSCIAAIVMGCVPSDDRGEESSTQAVAGPGGVVVTAPAACQLTATWTADPLAFKYYIYQAADGGALAFTASVLDPSAQPPAPTTYTASQLIGGTTYCYAVQSAYPDGSTSDIGAMGCAVATGISCVAAPSVPLAPHRAIPLFSSFGGSYTEQPVTEMVFPTNNIAEYPVHLDGGEAITSVTARVRCGRAGAVTMKLFRRDVSGPISFVTQIGTSATCTGSSSLNETLSIPGLSEVAGSGLTAYMLDFTAQNSGPVVLDTAWIN